MILVLQVHESLVTEFQLSHWLVKSQEEKITFCQMSDETIIIIVLAINNDIDNNKDTTTNSN